MGIRSNFEKNWSESGKYHHGAGPRSAVPGSAAGTVFGVAVCHADSGEQYVSEGSGSLCKVWIRSEDGPDTGPGDDCL